MPTVTVQLSESSTLSSALLNIEAVTVAIPSLTPRTSIYVSYDSCDVIDTTPSGDTLGDIYIVVLSKFDFVKSKYSLLPTEGIFTVLLVNIIVGSAGGSGGVGNETCTVNLAVNTVSLFIVAVTVIVALPSPCAVIVPAKVS